MQQQEQRSTIAAPPRPASIDAAVSLLVDGDRRIFDACRRQLLAWGSLARPSLERATNHPDAQLRGRARAILRALDLEDWLAALRNLAFRLRHEVQDRVRWSLLEEGACLLTEVAAPGRSVRRSVATRLDDLAARLRHTLRVRTAAAAARAITELLAEREGYTGDAASYYELDNLLFDSVLAKKKGMPVSLCMLYILVGRRLGLSLSGVWMPEHFLVRLHGVRPVLVDPFHGGRTITKADCLRYLRSAGYASDASSLSEVDDRAILLAFLGDLQRVYGYREDREICEILQRARRVLAGA